MSIGNLNTAPEEMKAGRTEQRRPEATVRRLRAGNEDITIGENSILEGSFDTQGAMFVDGAAVNADLRAAHLSIGTTGRVEGQATVLRAEIAGSFDGMLECAGEIILRSSSRIAGEIKCAKLVTHRGAIIAAQVRIVDDERPEDEQGFGLRAGRGRPAQPPQAQESGAGGIWCLSGVGCDGHRVVPVVIPYV